MFVFEAMDHSIQLRTMTNLKDMADGNMFSWGSRRKKHLESWELFGAFARGHYYDHRFESMFRSLTLILEPVPRHPFPIECDVIGQALDFFEHDENHLIHRVWVLGLIQKFQMYHPVIDVLSASSSEVQGTALSRVGLALYLTQKMDLFSPMVNSVSYSAAWIPNDLKEALKRVDLLYHIGTRSQETDQTPRSPIFMKVYDDLLQASCPLGDKKARSMAERCIEGIGMREDKTIEEEWMEEVLLHLYTFRKSAKKYIKESLSGRFGSSNKRVKEYFERIKTRGNRTLKRKQIQRYLSNEHLDPFIANLLTPFTYEVPVKLDHYRYILECFEAHNTIRYELFDDISHNWEMYSSDKRFVISVLYSESPYITGASRYLASRIKRGNYPMIHPYDA
ncbi:uncharacterized protein MELLADRAFT_67529 [Melampsora larici-populina 98AG31]|uniref:Uncharacterized protein n=1 Tax=Melampsora larici-populina (strain 98AG31 / pathotype 3-4-7) TaxID=747676 RepID=F4S3G6_MELLP|nr:uncharacterized protein MELLADRAFT_67529 [Melampsora larici-populina 98AG31]EGG00808.1 hypothetical protein MELLADRAFT_67529 [Melampsora larici-populina 98AG31]